MLGGTHTVSISIDTRNNIDSNIFEQTIKQGEEPVAVGRYIIGERAQNLGPKDTFSGYSHGMKLVGNTLYTATVLSELTLLDGKTITLNVSGAQNWGAHLTGKGGVEYVGGDKMKDVVTIKQLFKSNYDGKESVEEADSKDHLNRPNDYEGATIVTNVTLNLEREASLGDPGVLIANNANIVEVKGGALGTLDTINFTNTELTTKDTSLKVAGDATFAGENTLRSDSGKTIAFEAGTLKITGADLTASSVNVTGNSTVSGKNTVTANTFTTQGLTLDASANLDASGSLTAGDAQLSAGTVLSATNVKVDGALTMRGSSITADTLTAAGDFTLSGTNTISTPNGAVVTGNVDLAEGVSLDVNRGKLTAANVTVDSGAKLHVADGLTANQDVTVNSGAEEFSVTGGLNVGGTLTLGTAGSDTNTSNFSVGKLKVGTELVFVGNGYSSDSAYMFDTLVSALKSESTYNVSLKKANVEYASRLQNVGTTTLDQAHLTLSYDNVASLGHVVMTNTSPGSEKSQNLLTLKSDSGFVIGNRFSVEGSAADVIELSGTGKVTFANNAFAGDNYKGWIRMTGTTVDLADALNSDPGLSLSVGRGGTIVYDESVARIVHRLGWTSEGDSKLSPGLLDLSGVDFAQFGTNDEVLKVQELVVSGSGTILLNKSAVQNIGTSGAAQGDDIFDAISGGDSRLVIRTITGHDQEYYGSIGVKVEGADEKPLTGFFDANGKFTGDTLAAALGTWGYTAEFSDRGLGLEVTYGLDKLQLLTKNTQEGVGAFTFDTTQHAGHTDFGVTLTGRGDLNVTGPGTLHLTGATNTMTGTVYVKSGTLMAEAGSLGSEKEHASLDVAEGAEFQLNGVQGGTKRQYLRSLTSKGDVTIGDANNTSLVVLELDEGGTLYADSRLKGGKNSVLCVADGTLIVQDLGNVAATNSDDAFAGRILLEDNATLSLEGTKDGYAADLSMVTGTGTIVLKDSAMHDTTGKFAGTTKVAGGHLVIDGEDARVTSNANLAMTEDGGLIESKGEHFFNSVVLTGGVLDVGKVQAGNDIASGALHGKNVNLDNVEIKVAVESEDTVNADNILEIDNVEGKNTWLVQGDEVTTGKKIKITGLDDAKKYSRLIQDGAQVGLLHYAIKQNSTDKGVGINTKANALTLTGTLKLEGALEQNADTKLDLAVDGEGTIHVTSQTVTIAQANKYGALEVDSNATVNLDATQTLTQGGRISGNVNGDAGLNVTGGTLTVNGMDENGFDVHVGSNASLAFNGLTGSPNIFKGAVTADEGSTVSFSGTTGNFKPVEGKTAYDLTKGSSVTFTYVPEKNRPFKADTVSVDDSSSAYFDVQGKAGATDLSKISGEGRVVLGYAATPEAVGTLDVTAIGSGFTGTLAFANATATIGTDESVKNSVLNKFATKQGELEVGAGSTLVVNNQKDRTADGSFKPHAVKLAGDLTISDRATLDFTAGVFDDHGKDHLGNTSGLSVNALDLGGNHLVVTDSGDSKLTVRASIGKLDFGTGLPSKGEYHGSILDMLGEMPDYPVLTVIENIRLDDLDDPDAISAIASSMVLEGVDEDDEMTVKFWQPNWDPESEHETVHVANVKTGVKLVGVKNENGRLGSIAIGAGITGIDIVSGATLRIDASASESGASVMDASITEKDKPGNVLVTKSLGNAPEEGVKFLAENTYTGETEIDFGAKATVGHASAFASSKVVRVGTMEKDANGNLLKDKSILVLDTTQVKGSSYENAVKMKAIELGANGKLEIKTRNDLILTGNGTSTFAAKSVVTGDALTTIGLADGNLTIKDLKSISGFEGAFRVNTGASVNFTVEDGSYTWTNDVRSYTDARSRATGAGKFVKSGAGTLVIGDKQFAQPNLSGMNLVVAEGTAELNGAKILGLETRKGTVVDVNGIFTTHNLTADAGSVFNLNVVTGKPFNVKEGESTSKKSIWGLGENGSDGIRVTGTASGTLNLAVTPKEVGAEESIQLVDAADTKEGFTVSLVDEKGAKLEGLTVGAYDYTLVRKDDAQNGTDIFLSSIPGEDEKRNTTVTAGSYIGVAAAAQLFDISLHDRMSNRSWLTANADGSIANSFWVLETVSNERYGDSTGQIDVHDTASTTTVGSDILSGLAAGGTWYAGAMFSYATQDTKSRSNRTALESRADTDAWAAGLYAGWQLNGADRTGPYVDGWILWTDAESDVKGVNVSETVDGNGLSASIEAGWGFKALSYNAHGQAGDIYVEPHVSVTWFGYEADDVSNDVHDVTFEGKDNIRTKLGVKTYAFGKNSGGFSPYVELNWIHNTETYGVTMSNVTVEQVGAEDQGEVRAGADWRINDAFTVWGHFGITSGSDGYSNREASLGVRYNF